MNITLPQGPTDPTPAPRQTDRSTGRRARGPADEIIIQRAAEPRRQRKKQRPRLDGDIFTPEIPDVEPERKDVYYGTIVERLVRYINERRKSDASRYGFRARVSWANLSRLTGIEYGTLFRYFGRRDRAIPIQVVDKCLWALKISVLDLIEPLELTSYLASLTYPEQHKIHSALKRLLDKAAKQAQNTVSASSQAQNHED